ncbi:MAG: isoleucyl-tRNA synthetase, partial [Verrucomicrobiota bacterium]
SDANEAVLHELRLRHALIHQENYHHSYPHCWRSKNPVIFRAMDQWFIKIDHNNFRQRALAEIDLVSWVPDWGKSRIEAAVKGRPDWCISRQRTWGVPIPAFYDGQGNAVLDAQIVRNAADLIEKHGSNVWFEKSAPELWSALKPAGWKGAEPTVKSNDTLDVWIDSGSSSRAVLMRRPELSHGTRDTEHVPLNWQADMYLEGSDQHRGWFQSSLLLSLAGNGAAPYKTVLTHGFMVDADREKISKSKQGQGIYEKPQTSEAYIKKYGADIVRLWVASQDFRSDITVSDERINKVAETYRVLRNALRYQISNLYDFDPAKHGVSDDKLTGLDRWILTEFSKLEQAVLAAYDSYEFHVVYQRISQFVAVELSAIYHDAIKDRLYTDPANSQRRRSTQTTLRRLGLGLCKMLAPVLVFTADEAWEFIPAAAGSAHETDWKGGALTYSPEEEAGWQWVAQWRERVLPQLEKLRQEKAIGKALEAKVEIVVPQAQAQLAEKNRESLRELLNVSALTVSSGSDPAVKVTKADGQKCERCWHWETDVGSHPDHPTICARCVKAVQESAAQVTSSPQ